jgi:hypothetical protein
MTAARRWTGGRGFGRIRAKGLRPRTLARLVFVVVNDITGDRCTVLECFDKRADAEQLIKGVAGAAVFESPTKLTAGARATHAAGVVWTFNAAEVKRGG